MHRNPASGYALSASVFHLLSGKLDMEYPDIDPGIAFLALEELAA